MATAGWPKMSDNRVFLPIHQCLEPKQILTIATAVKELLSA